MKNLKRHFFEGRNVDKIAGTLHISDTLDAYFMIKMFLDMQILDPL